MAEPQDITLKVNGKRLAIRAAPEMPLLWALRQEAGLSGTKFGCGGGYCGACTVHIGGEATRSCQVPVGEVDKVPITTVEGLARDPLGQRLTKAWLELDVMQCGYCQAGQLMSAHALLRAKPKPSLPEIDAAMDGNLCRCATYTRIRAAILMASGQEAHHDG
jgi:isoquinoline 1-oxidoreductase subunit alpha